MVNRRSQRPRSAPSGTGRQILRAATRGTRDLSPAQLERVAYVQAYRTLRTMTADRSGAQRAAKLVAAALAQHWPRVVRAVIRLPDSAVIDWSRVGICYDPSPTDPRPQTPAAADSTTDCPDSTSESMDSIQDSNGDSIERQSTIPVAPQDGTSVATSRTAPPPQRLQDSIPRGDVVTLLRSLLARASDDQMSPSDAVRLADAIARIEGFGRGERDITINLVLYNSEVYAHLVAAQGVGHTPPQPEPA